MTKHKYVGLDVHQATTSIAVLDLNGKLLSQSTVQTSSQEICDSIGGFSGREVAKKLLEDERTSRHF